MMRTGASGVESRRCTNAAQRSAKGHQASTISVVPIAAVVVWRSTTRSAASAEPLGPRAASISSDRSASAVPRAAALASFSREKHRFKSSSAKRRLIAMACSLARKGSTPSDSVANSSLTSHTPVYSFPCVPPTTTMRFPSCTDRRAEDSQRAAWWSNTRRRIIMKRTCQSRRRRATVEGTLWSPLGRGVCQGSSSVLGTCY